MPSSLFQYEMLPTTWVFLSALMILALFFKFNRFWSVRNLDLVALILLSPGLLYLAMYDNQTGYVWLFGVHLFFFVRLLFDTVMVRRPLLEPNLTSEALTFASLAILAFLIGATLVNRGDRVDSARTIRLEQILSITALSDPAGNRKTISDDVPGYRPFFAFVDRANRAVAPTEAILPQLKSRTLTPGDESGAHSNSPENENADSSANEGISLPDAHGTDPTDVPTAVSLAETLGEQERESKLEQTNAATREKSGSFMDFLSLAAIVSVYVLLYFGFLIIGHCHFGNARTGIAAATIYLLHPYTNQMLGRLDHSIPGVLILWAVVFYRRPIFSGLLLGLASALVFYPIFLVPLWCAFYWKRGWVRFLCAVVFVYVLLISLISCTPVEYGTFAQQVANLFGRGSFLMTNPDGLWEILTPVYRIPILALFLAFSFGTILWPSHKNLATLLCCSAAMMISVQFWQSHQGGLFMAWYLPLLILTIFRPNLEDRTAVATVVDPRRFF